MKQRRLLSVRNFFVFWSYEDRKQTTVVVTKLCSAQGFEAGVVRVLQQAIGFGGQFARVAFGLGIES